MTWTVSDYEWMRLKAIARKDQEMFEVLVWHHPYTDHCGGYDVHAWPCPDCGESGMARDQIDPADYSETQ